MSGFKKTVSTEVRLSGTQLKNGIPCVSTGIPSFDYVIGGCVPVGSLIILEEDVLGNYSRIMSKYFLSEAVVSKQAVFLASVDENPQQIMREIPMPILTSETEPHQRTGSEEMKIAWRYEGQAAVESSFGGNTHFGHNFDLSKHIDEDTIKNSDVCYWNNLTTKSTSPEFRNPLYYDLLHTIKEHLSKDGYSMSSNAKKVLRICVMSVGSPLWMAHEFDADSDPRRHGSDIVKFMYCLRIILRGTTAVALVTVPSHLFEDNNITTRLQNSSDYCVRLESFAGTARAANPALQDYHGLLRMLRAAPPGCAAPALPPALDLAFKLRRKKFLIEKLHLPPELQESSEREQDDITAVPTATSCGGFKKKDIDF